MKRSQQFGVFVAAAAFSLVFQAESRGGLMTSGNTVAVSGSDFTFSYGVNLTGGSLLRPGDYFTIYDFRGFVAGSNTQPSNFTFSSANVGPTPAGATPTDSASIANVTWTYNGPSALVGPKTLGRFTANSVDSSTSNGAFVGVSLRAGEGGSAVDVAQSQVSVPAPHVSCVPEPASMAMIGAGLPLLGLFRRFRFKN